MVFGHLDNFIQKHRINLIRLLKDRVFAINEIICLQ